MADLMSMFGAMDVERVPMREPSAHCHPIFDKPLATVDELIKSGLIPLSRNAMYSAVKNGHIETLRIGRSIFVKTIPLKKKLGL